MPLLLALPVAPSPSRGWPSPAGEVWEGDQVQLDDGRRGVVARVVGGEQGDPWMAAVMLDGGGVDYAVAPSEVESVRPRPARRRDAARRVDGA